METLEKMTVTLPVDAGTWILVEWRRRPSMPYARDPFPVCFVSGVGGKKQGEIEGICERHSREQRAAGNDVHVAAYQVAANLDYPALADFRTFVLIDNESIPLGTETAEEVAA